ncbi:MAG: SCO family protein [Acidobacteria bacterium]|nr:SCO family protein [Acidobacteriota bacterium]MBI3421573.1 SCO family protein [Acidobacteriota bacterium]
MNRRTLLKSALIASAPPAFPNFVLRTHENQTVRFYDDLLKDKLVLLNFFYAQCDDFCPAMTANLVKVQKLLGARCGRDVFMYSLSLKPEQDTPRALKKFAEMHGVKPGWLLLTGKRAELEILRRKFGLYDPDPAVDRDVTQHTGLVRFGSAALDRWAACPALSNPAQIVRSLGWLAGPAWQAKADQFGAHSHAHESK